MTRVILAGLFVIFGLMSANQSVSALGLKIAPLEYKSMLADKERKRGFIDVSNPSGQPVSVIITVQAFRQIDNNGGLQFYEDKQIQSGITPELTTIEIGPREAVRIAFTIDGSQLPEGDVYAAIFFTTDPKQPRNGVGQLVRVGTIFSIVNKTPGERSATVTGLNLPFLQLSDTVGGTYKVKNTGKEGSGFYPGVNVSSWPGNAQTTVESSLVFGGRERSNDFSLRTGYGIYRVDVGFGDSKKSRWVVAIAPWMLIASLLVLVIIGIELLLLKKRRKARPKSHSKSHASTPEK